MKTSTENGLNTDFANSISAVHKNAFHALQRPYLFLQEQFIYYPLDTNVSRELLRCGSLMCHK